MTSILKELCIEITNVCPMACLHCSTSSIQLGSESGGKNISFQKLTSVVEEFKGLGGEILEISGGEPLLHPQLFELIQFGINQDLEVRLYTAGIVSLKGNDVGSIDPQLARKLKTSGVSRVIFSLQGAVSQTHDKIVGFSGAYSLALKSIRNIKDTGLSTGLHFVPMALNFREIEAMMELGSSLKVDELALLRFVPQGRGSKNQKLLEMSLESFEKLLKQVARLKENYPALNVRVGCPMDFLSMYEKGLQPHECKAGLSTCAITPDGDVVPCPGFKCSPDFIAGNIYEDSLTEIWEKGFASLREFDPDQINGECRTCSELKWCRGRCVAQRIIAYNDLYTGTDPCCPKQLKEKQTVQTEPPASASRTSPARNDETNKSQRMIA